jgi:hypothetical protein
MIINQKFYYIRRLGDTESRNIKALNFIMIELMQKYIKTDKAVGMNNLRRWPSDSLIVAFLSKTISITSVKRLMKVSEKIQSSKNIQFDVSSIRYLVVH